MGLRENLLYTGIKIYKDIGVELNTVYFDSNQTLQNIEWTDLQEIPADKHIVGFKCVTNDASPAAILHLSFLLANNEESEVSGELNYPSL